MAVRFYDDALASKIQNWIKDDSIKVLKPDETSRLFRMKADEGMDKPIALPIISLSRGTDIEILNVGKKPLSYDGLRLRCYDKRGNEVMPSSSAYKLNAIPISISYNLDIYTRDLEECDEYMRNFVFNFVNYPKLTITIPYNDVDIHHDSTVRLEPVVTDNSDIPERLFPSQFTRYTLRLVVDDAYLFSVPAKPFVAISEVGLRVKDSPDVDSTWSDEMPIGA